MSSQKIYYSVGLNDELPHKRTAGKITLEKGFVVFSYDGDVLRFSTDRTEIRIGGSGNGLVFFSHPDFKGWDIYTSDKSILRDPIARQDSSFAVVRSESQRTLAKTFAIVLTIAIVITGIFYLFKAFKDSMTYSIATQIPISVEKTLGDTAFKSYTRGKRLYNDPKLIEKLKPITDRLIEQTRGSGYEFRFHIIDDSHINAIAFPGGNILIHSALIKEAEFPEEIAGVLAHEISHVTLKHGIRHIINSVGLFIVVQSLIGDFSGLIAVLTQNSSIFLSSRFSRDYEREADSRGYDYLIKSKTNPKGLTKFFEKILELEKEDGVADNELIRFISTHPDTKERIDVINSKSKDLKDADFSPINFDLKALKQDIRNKEK